jgi:hypothetical protein
MIEFAPEHKTNILPLRWFANLCEKPASYHLNMYLHYSDHDDYGLACRFHAYASNMFYRPYLKWGTIYKVNMKAWADSIKDDPVLDKLGSDYDENGIPYWDKHEERLKYMEENGI